MRIRINSRRRSIRTSDIRKSLYPTSNWKRYYIVNKAVKSAELVYCDVDPRSIKYTSKKKSLVILILVTLILLALTIYLIANRDNLIIESGSVGQAVVILVIMLILDGLCIWGTLSGRSVSDNIVQEASDDDRLLQCHMCNKCYSSVEPDCCPWCGADKLNTEFDNVVAKSVINTVKKVIGQSDEHGF